MTPLTTDDLKSSGEDPSVGKAVGSGAAGTDAASVPSTPREADASSPEQFRRGFTVVLIDDGDDPSAGDFVYVESFDAAEELLAGLVAHQDGWARRVAHAAAELESRGLNTVQHGARTE